jgi:hypothetical protein
MSFADAEARVAASALARVSNATANVAGGSFPVIFDRDFLAALGGQINASGPMCSALSADVTANDVAFGTLVTINDVDYTVRDVQPDGTGMTVLILELAT